jgi:hypothetical protein
MTTAVSAVGLVFDGLGALVLVIGTIRARGAAIRAMAATMPTAQLPLIQRNTVKATQSVGPTNVQLTTPNLIGDYTAMVWGTGFLVLGFVAQLIGQVMGACR